MPFASYVMQATCFFTIGFCLWPTDVNRYGGGRVFPQRGGRGGDGVCRLVCLSGASLAGWPLAKLLDTALERIFVVISIAAGISALLLLPF